jgi:hypothetical protein
MNDGGRIGQLTPSERQLLSRKALEARWGRQHSMVPKHVCRQCGHNRNQTAFVSKSLGEEVRKLHCLPAWGENHDPSIYYVIRDGIARQLSEQEMQQLEGRKHIPSGYPKCGSQNCPNYGKLMVQPRSQQCARWDGTSSYEVEVVTFICQDEAKHVLHSVHVLQPDGSRLEKIGERGQRYRGVDASGQAIETVPLTALHPLTRKPVNPAVREAKSEAHRRSWHDLDNHPKLQNSIAAIKEPGAQAKRLTNLIAAHKGKKYPHRGPLNISPEERKRRSVDAARREAEKKAAVARQKPGAKRNPIYAEAYRLRQNNVSWGKIAIKLLPSGYRIDPDDTVDKLKKGVKRLKTHENKKPGS